MCCFLSLRVLHIHISNDCACVFFFCFHTYHILFFFCCFFPFSACVCALFRFIFFCWGFFHVLPLFGFLEFYNIHILLDRFYLIRYFPLPQLVHICRMSYVHCALNFLYFLHYDRIVFYMCVYGTLTCARYVFFLIVCIHTSWLCFICIRTVIFAYFRIENSCDDFLGSQKKSLHISRCSPLLRFASGSFFKHTSFLYKFSIRYLFAPTCVRVSQESR